MLLFEHGGGRAATGSGSGTVLLVGGALVTWSPPEVLHRGSPTVDGTVGDTYTGDRTVSQVHGN